MNADSSVFHVKNLTLFVLNHAPFSLADDLFTFAERLDYQDEGIDVCLGIIDTLFNMTVLIQGKRECPSRCLEIVYNKILPTLTISNEYLLLAAGEQDGANMYLTIQAGFLLSKIGTYLQHDSLLRLGRRMIVSALSVSDENGLIPYYIPLNQEINNVTIDKYITPESIYDLLIQHVIEDSFYPREWESKY